MKASVKFLALMAMVVALGACGLDIPVPAPSTTPFSIEALPAGDFTKATDTAFEVGDAVNVYVFKGDGFSGINTWQPWITNAKFTKTQSGFSSEQAYYWYEGEEKGIVIGLYPYNATHTAEALIANGVTFCVKSDQSTHAGYTASDLMTAFKSDVTPTAEKVTLEFDHLLSKLIIDIDNQTAADIKEVYIDGVKGNLNYSFSTGVVTTGGEGTIKAGELSTATAGYTDTHILIIPPQTAAPSIAITTTNGKQYTYDASEQIEFRMGKVRHLMVTLTENSISTEFDAIVNDWSADESVEFTDQPSIDDGGNTPDTPNVPGMEVNPNWSAYYIPDFEDTDGTIYDNIVCIESNDEQGFYLEFFTLDEWNTYVAPDMRGYVEDRAAYLVQYTNDYNATNGTDYTIANLRSYYVGPGKVYYLMEPGTWVAAMWGMTTEGEVTGLYAASEPITITDPYPEYNAWLGSWRISDGDIESNITLTADVVGESYNMEGWNNIGGIPTKVKYNAENDSLVFYGQVVGENVDIGEGMLATIYFAGIGTNNGLYANADLAEAVWFGDNSALISAYSYIYTNEAGEEVPLTFTEIRYFMEIEGSLYYATEMGHSMAEGMTMTRITEQSQAPAQNSLLGDSRFRRLDTSAPSKHKPISGLFKAGECRFNF